MRKNLIKTALVYLMYLYVPILLSVFSSGIPIVITRFIIKNSGLVEDIVLIIWGLLIETAVLILMFYRLKYNDRSIGKRDFLTPLLPALIISLVISMMNSFFPYTAGMLVTCGGTLVGRLMNVSQEHIMISPFDVPSYVFFILFGVRIVITVAAVSHAYNFASKKLSKEREELLGSKDTNI